MSKPLQTKPIKTSVFLPPNVHKLARERAAENEVSTSVWIARTIAKALGVRLANENKLTYY